MTLRYHMDEFLMGLRLETKAEENEGKPPITSPDLAETGDFVFSRFENAKDSGGQMLLARRRGRRRENHIVKHAYTDLACNEFVYSKLLTAMGLRAPGAMLLRLSEVEERPYFTTEYIVALSRIDIVKAAPSLDELREGAKNWRQLFSFRGLYAMLGERGGMETPLAGDGYVYRVNAQEALPVRRRMLDYGAAGLGGAGAATLEEELAAVSLESIVDAGLCDMWLDKCLAVHPDCKGDFLAPFAAIGQIPQDYIDDFLNTLCYIYPDALGAFYKRFIEAAASQAVQYYEARK